MRRIRLLILGVLIQTCVVTIYGTQLSSYDILEQTWKEFRQIHPYNYQTVALKHVGEYCVFVISEPSDSVGTDDLRRLFLSYGGIMDVKYQSFGYDGKIEDIVGMIHFSDDKTFNLFTRELFIHLYGTDYKAYYTDLDHPTKHVYFSPYRLNYSTSFEELFMWFYIGEEMFKSAGNDKKLTEILSNSINGTNELFYSKERGFVAWVFSSDKINDITFRENARKFVLDTDLIIGALGNVDDKFAIIARERVVPVSVLPPLRVETIQFLNRCGDSLIQNFEAVRAQKKINACNKYTSRINLSDELQNTELGSLFCLTDLMLKSWSENKQLHNFNYDYPDPIGWGFNKGVSSDLKQKALTYIWSSSNIGDVKKNVCSLDFYTVKNTGSLAVKFLINGGLTNINKIKDAEETAYDFFSNLNNIDLVRVAQYTALFQIFKYYKKTINSRRPSVSSTSNTRIITPSIVCASVEIGNGGQQIQIVKRAAKAIKGAKTTIRPYPLPNVGTSITGQNLITNGHSKGISGKSLTRKDLITNGHSKGISGKSATNHNLIRDQILKHLKKFSNTTDKLTKINKDIESKVDWKAWGVESLNIPFATTNIDDKFQQLIMLKSKKRELLGERQTERARGLDVKQYYAEGKDFGEKVISEYPGDINAYINNLANNPAVSDISNIEISEYSAREVRVTVTTKLGAKQEIIVERAMPSIFDVNKFVKDDIDVKYNMDGTFKIIFCKPSGIQTIFKKVKLYFNIVINGAREGARDVIRNSMKKILSAPQEEIDNPVKLRNMLKRNGLDLRDIHCTMEDLSNPDFGKMEDGENTLNNIDWYEMVLAA